MKKIFSILILVVCIIGMFGCKIVDNSTQTDPIKTFGASDLEVAVGNSIARWYAKYDTSGIEVTVKVKDKNIIVGNKNIGYDDNIEFDIGLISNEDGRDTTYTYNLLATAGGKYFFRKAVSSTLYGPENDLSLNIAPGSNFWIDVQPVTFSDGDTGYVVKVYFGYDLLNIDAETAIGNLTISPSLRNSEPDGTSWSSESSLGNLWGKAKDFAIITEDGRFLSRK